MAEKLRKGGKVTVAEMQFHGVIVDTHTSHVVRRLNDAGELANVVVGDDDVQPQDEVLDSATSYLVHRSWDNTDIWLEESLLTPGHDMTAQTDSLQPAAATDPAGSRG